MSKNGELTMLLVGDVHVCRDDPPSMFQHVRSLLRGADFTLGNLEAAVADSGTPWPKVPVGHNWKADARQIVALESAGFHAMTVANNHMMDFGCDALLETLGRLDQLGIAHTGGGRNFNEAHAPAVVEREGCRVALLGYTSVFIDGWQAGPESAGLAVMRGKTAYEPPARFLEGPGRPPLIRTWVIAEDKAQLSADIAAARSQADIVVCTFHWGVSAKFKKLADYQIELGRHAIDSGADLVFGHHPHVVQGVDVHQGKVIFYSLGNFAFDTHGDSHERESMIVRCRIQDRRIKTVEFLPVLCADKGNPRVLDLTDGKPVVELIKERSAEFPTRFVADGDAIRISSSAA